MSQQSEIPWHTSITVFSVSGVMQIIAESNDVPVKAFNFIKKSYIIVVLLTHKSKLT